MFDVNEEEFNEAVKFMNDSVSNMNSVTTMASSISAPSDFPGTATLESVKSGISGSLKPKMEAYISSFRGFSASVASLIGMEEELLAATDSLNEPIEIIEDAQGNDIAIKTATGVISLDNFKAIESDKGTYYQWTGVGTSGLSNASDIYVPKIEKLEGVLVYFTAYGQDGNLGADANIRNFKNGKIDTTGIVIIPTNYEKKLHFNANEAKSYTVDAQNIAQSFGIDPKNINVFGWSQAGWLAGDLVKNNPDGTFKTAIFCSTRYGVEDVTDPNVKVISILGEGEQGNENGEFVQALIEEYRATHENEVELYIIPASEEYDRVGHMTVTAAAASSDLFNGQGIFEYGISNGDSTSV